MRFAGAVLACLAVGAVSEALADPPSSPPEQSAVAEPAAATTTSATEAATAKSPVTAPQTASAASTTAAVDPEEKRLISQGYKPVMRNGQKVFCRREATLGSRFETVVCARAEQLKSVRQNSEDVVEEAQRHRITPDLH